MKKEMRKLLAVLTAAVIATSLAACASSNEESAGEDHSGEAVRRNTFQRAPGHSSIPPLFETEAGVPSGP